MHALEVIVARNERAAAREEAHAVNDGNWYRAKEIRMADGEIETAAYSEAYRRAREEN